LDPQEEVIRGWRKLLNDELHNLNFVAKIISDQVKEDEMGRACGVLRRV
jgi:hypothetical protein